MLTNNTTNLIVLGGALFGVMLVVGILGIVGTLKQSTCLLVTYCICVWILFGGFWAIFAVFSRHKSNNSSGS